MILLLSLGFGLGVLAVVPAGEIERRRNRFVFHMTTSPLLVPYPRKPADEIRARVHRVVDSLNYQDSTLP